jgi:hypothetical protein
MSSRLGRVTQVSPLRVQLNGDSTDAPAEALDDFTGATANANTGTEVLVETVERRRFARRVR